MMSKIILVIIMTVFTCGNVYSQTKTKKYNSLMERYEYFDSSGSMIGYEKYNSLMERWEYFDIKSKNNSNKYGDYIKPVNTALIAKGLEAKQNRYDNNVSIIQSKITFIDDAFQLYFKYQRNPEIAKRITTIKDLHSSFIEGVGQIKGYDFSSNATTQNVLNWLKQYETKLNNIASQIKNE